MASQPARSPQNHNSVSINVDIVHESEPSAHRPAARPAALFAAAASEPRGRAAPARDDLEPILITAEDQQSPFYVRQHDILDDGLPPIPRAGWPTKQVDCYVRLFSLAHLPRTSGPVSGRSHFSVELSLGDSLFKNPPCPGDVDEGCVLNQVLTQAGAALSL